MWIDTHCHLNAAQLNQDVTTLVNQAIEAGVLQQFVVGWDEASSLEAVKLARSFPSIKAIIGQHPVDAKHISIDKCRWVEQLAISAKDVVIAIGEIGLDYHWDKNQEQHRHQAAILQAQMTIANQLNLPIVVHCRDAYEPILPIFETSRVNKGGIMHCYGGPAHLVERFLNLGFDLSFGGPVTFKQAHEARLALHMTPLNRLHIETDSPYLAPHPYRGQLNTPAHLRLIGEYIAQLRNLSIPTLQTILKENANHRFGMNR
jgi:TatD DNase family protein